MAHSSIIREPNRKVPPGLREAEKVSSECIHCAKGWVYQPNEETGDELAMGCWMCPKGRAIEKAGA